MVELAARRGVHTLGLSDHDTIAGLPEAFDAGARLGVTVVPGVEFSTRHEYDRHFVGIHILGYFFDPRHPALQEVVRQVQAARVEQKVRQIEKLQSLGFDISVEEVFAHLSGVPGRPHIAAVLMARYPGRFASVQQVFDEYLGVGKQAHVGRTFALTVAEAVALIREAGGLPVLAHPAAYGPQVDVSLLVRNAVSVGVEGVEVYYPYPRLKDGGRAVAQIEAMARRYRLWMTGGSDFHGRPNDPASLGEMGMATSAFESLRTGWVRR
ncbi:MAG: hypothetical protein D6796_11330 [Caldilineae bacterium]|nr:MAG: hypothetical protein D6796_11330 [Caldilineae bacterium]